MATPNPVADRNLDGYGAPPIEWKRVLSSLGSGLTQAPDTGGPNRHTTWLATANPDGTPHVMPLGSGWIDGAFWFTSGPGTRKSRNLAANPACVISVATHDFDVVAEGTATRVTDEATLERICAAYNEDGAQHGDHARLPDHRCRGRAGAPCGTYCSAPPTPASTA